MGRRLNQDPRVTASPSAKGLISIVVLAGLLFGASGCPVQQEVSGRSPSDRSQWTSWSIGNVIIRALATEGTLLWIGTSNGIIRFDTVSETHEVFSTREGLLSNVVVSITVDPKGNKWFGTYGGGLSRFDGSRWEHFTPYGRGSKDYGAEWVRYSPRSGLGDLWVYNVFFDREGTMWVATWEGASRYNGQGFETYTVEDGLVDRWVYTIGQDASGVLWFGTEGGINSFDGKRFNGWTHDDGLGAEPTERRDGSRPMSSPHHQQKEKGTTEANPNYVISATIDRSGVKWFGTWGGGLSRFDGKRFRNYTTADGLAGNVVNALTLDDHGILWIGTDGGVSRFDGKRFENLTVREGLFGNHVYSIAVGPDGSKWFGTFGGVSRYTGD